MWIFTVSEPLADSLYWWFSALLILGSVVVLIATIGTILMSSAKEQFANERLSANETETARAKESAALATKAAENERLERLKLEVRLSPRTLKGAAARAFAQDVSAAVKGLRIDLVAYEAMGADVAPLCHDLQAALTLAGAIPHIQTPMGGGGVVNGILVRTAADASAGDRNAVGPIVAALIKAGFAAGPWAEYPKDEPPAGAYTGPGQPLGKLRILVGSK